MTAAFQGSAVVDCLERLWAAIRVHHPDLPRVVVILASGTERGAYRIRGHWGAARWCVEDGENVGEVMLAGERLADGPVGVLSTMLHEAAHGLAFARDIAETSRNGRYHNDRFRELAEAVGLVVSKSARDGFNVTEPAAATLSRYGVELEQLAAVLSGFRNRPDAIVAFLAAAGKLPAGDDGEAKQPKRSSRTLLECRCDTPRKLRASPAVAELGPITCGLCGADFAPPEPEAAAA